MKKILLILVFLFAFGFVLAEEPTFTASQASAYDAIITSRSSDTVSLPGMTEADLSKLMTEKATDPNYATFIEKMSDKDFDRAIENDPKLLNVVVKDSRKNVADTPILKRLKGKIAKDRNYINAGSRGLVLGADRTELKKEFLKISGFEPQDRDFSAANPYNWKTVEVDSFDDKTGVIGLKTSDGVTKVNTYRVKETCANLGKETCLTLMDDGSIQAPGGIKLSNGMFEPSIDSTTPGQINFKVQRDGNQIAIVDIESIDAKTGKTNLDIDAAGTEIRSGSRLIASDTKFKASTLGSGTIKVSDVGTGQSVVFNQHVGWITGDNKFAELTGGSVEYDFNEGIMKGKVANLGLIDQNGKSLLKLNSYNGVVSNHLYGDIQGYAKDQESIITLGQITEQDVVSVREGLWVSGTKVTAYPAAGKTLTIDDFQNGGYFSSDLTNRANSKVVQKVEGSATINHEYGKGSSFSGSGRGLFRGVSKCYYGKDENGQPLQTKIIFDEAIIYGEDKVKLYRISGAGSDYDINLEQEIVAYSSQTANIGAVITTLPARVRAVDGAMQARIKGLESRIDSKPKLNDGNVNWNAMASSVSAIAGLSQDRAKAKCPSLTDAGENKCNSVSVCMWNGNSCTAKSQ